MSRISIEVSDEQHKKIKIMASLQNKSIRDFVLDNIFSNQKNSFNEKTLEAIEDIRKENNLNVYHTVNDLFAKFSDR